MTRLVLILILFTTTFETVFCQKPLLTIGKYLIVYKSELGDSYNLIIKDSTFTEYNMTDTISGKIVWLDNSKFILKNSKKREPQNELEKNLESLGEICFVINSNSSKEYKFRTTYVGQLHVTMNVGTIIKIDTNEKKLIVPEK